MAFVTPHIGPIPFLRFQPCDVGFGLLSGDTAERGDDRHERGAYGGPHRSRTTHVDVRALTDEGPDERPLLNDPVLHVVLLLRHFTRSRDVDEVENSLPRECLDFVAVDEIQVAAPDAVEERCRR